MTSNLKALTIPEHVAIIMDGNGRWANTRGLTRLEGHHKGGSTAKQIVKSAHKLGIKHLTLWAFSAENWSRPLEEVNGLIHILRIMLRNELAELHKSGARLQFIGNMKQLPKDVSKLAQYAEELTSDNEEIIVNIAFNYGGRQDITSAVRKIAEQVQSGEINPKDIDIDTISQNLSTKQIPDPELIIRTSGETRVSNFMLWEMAYSEFVFCNVLWPDFTENDLIEAINEYSCRERRFGGFIQKVGKQQ